MEIRRTDDEALERFRSYHLDIWKNFYAAMSRRQVEDGNYLGSLIKSGLFVLGSVDTVRRQLVEQWKTFPAEYVALVNHYAQMPKEIVIETPDNFMRHVKPGLDEIISNARR